MSEKEPNKPLTRSELRKQRQKLARVERPSAEAASQIEKEYEVKDKKIKQFFRREKKKNKPLTTSRSAEQEKTAALGRFLNKAILGVTILLVIVFIAIFYF